MLSSEPSLGVMGTKIRIAVMSSEGQLWDVEIEPHVTIAELKQKAFEQFYKAGVSDINYDAYRRKIPTNLKFCSALSA